VAQSRAPVARCRTKGFCSPPGAGRWGLGWRVRSRSRLSIDALATGDGGPLSVGDDCTPRTLQSAVGLVWRAVILWMILLLMLTIAVWLA
jgi:hypothetical protein